MGIAETALCREDALLAIGLLENAMVPVLDGDVCFRRGPEIVPAYANWHCDRREGETDDAYVHRSAVAARNYILRFPTLREDMPVFVVVPDEVGEREGRRAGP